MANGVTGVNTVLARSRVVRVQKSGQEHVKQKESGGAFLKVVSGDFQASSSWDCPQILLKTNPLVQENQKKVLLAI